MARGLGCERGEIGVGGWLWEARPAGPRSAAPTRVHRPCTMGNRSAADAGGLLAGRGAGVGAAGEAALVGGVLLIGAVLAGNSLVCVSVASERVLQTPTNYFILSLAAADLLLALLVLPLFVYSEVSQRRSAPATPSPPCPHRGSARGSRARAPAVADCLVPASPPAILLALCHLPVLASAIPERPLSLVPGTLETGDSASPVSPSPAGQTGRSRLAPTTPGRAHHAPMRHGHARPLTRSPAHPTHLTARGQGTTGSAGTGKTHSRRGSAGPSAGAGPRTGRAGTALQRAHALRRGLA